MHLTHYLNMYNGCCTFWCVSRHGRPCFTLQLSHLQIFGITICGMGILKYITCNQRIDSNCYDYEKLINIVYASLSLWQPPDYYTSEIQYHRQIFLAMSHTVTISLLDNHKTLILTKSRKLALDLSILFDIIIHEREKYGKLVGLTNGLSVQCIVEGIL